MLLAGLFGAVLSASASLAREIRSGTALAVLSKPIGRAQFLLAKYAGLNRGANDPDLRESRRGAHREPDDVRHLQQHGPGSGRQFCRGVVVATRWPIQQFFPAPAVRERRRVALLIMVTVAAFVIFQFSTHRLNSYDLSTWTGGWCRRRY